MLAKTVTEVNKQSDAAIEMTRLWTWLAQQT